MSFVVQCEKATQSNRSTLILIWALACIEVQFLISVIRVYEDAGIKARYVPASVNHIDLTYYNLEMLRGGAMFGQGARAPQIHLLPPSTPSPHPRFKNYLTILTWFLRSQNAPKSIFRCSAPDPNGGAYSAPPDPLYDGDGPRCPPKNPIPILALRASFLRVLGSNALQSWQPY